MESSHLVDGFGTHQPWMIRGGQLTSQGPRFSEDLGFESLFEKMNFSEEVGYVRSSSGRDTRVGGGENLVPRFANVGVNDYCRLYENGCYGPVGSPLGTVHCNFESYQSQFHQADQVHRAQMIELWRRNNMPHMLGEMGLPVSPYISQNGAEFAVDPRVLRLNKVVASSNVDGWSHGMCVDDVNLMDYRGQIASLATNPLGCKMLQMKLGDIKMEENEMILEEVIDKVTILMMDQFGNNLVQKLIEVCNEEQKTRIVCAVTKNSYQLIRICQNLHGTRVVQKLLENLTIERQISMMILALSPGVVVLTKDANAYHVIQHCLKHFSDKHNRYLINEIARNCYEIATDKCGCCVLQLCVDITKGEVREHLIPKITANALPLSEDRYGNYVVQHLLLMKVPSITTKLVNQLCGHFFSLSCNKYGSNVVEKCLTETGHEFSELVILELLKTPDVPKLLHDPFGNYVFQSALSISQGLLHIALVTLVKKHSASMCSNLYGKKILAWFNNRKRLSHMYATMHS